MLKYLLDTNVISEPPRARPSAKLLRKLQKHEGECAIASVSWHEVWHGIERLPKGPKRERLVVYFAMVRSAMPILPYEQRAAEWHAIERARLKKTPPFVDGQIAAIAAAHDLTLVTADADFDVFDVRIEDWLA